MISWMAKEFFAASPVLVLPVIALVIFMLAFALIACRTLLTRKAEFDRLANLPFEDEENHHG